MRRCNFGRAQPAPLLLFDIWPPVHAGGKTASTGTGEFGRMNPPSTVRYPRLRPPVERSLSPPNPLSSPPQLGCVCVLLRELCIIGPQNETAGHLTTIPLVAVPVVAAGSSVMGYR